MVAAFDLMESKVDTISGQLVMRLARHVADEMNITTEQRPRFSRGWMCSFQRRHGIRLRDMHGEAASVSDESVRADRQAMRRITDHYALTGVYNMDETSLYYRQERKVTLSRRKKRAGRKTRKNRLTLCLATNADGSDKLTPLFIDTAKNPRDLKGRDVERKLGIQYTNNKKAWINSRIFVDRLLALDERMRGEQRQILLLVDNVSSHVRPETELTNVRLEFLPKNTTSVLQPLDQGIIGCIKRKFLSIK